MGAHVAVVGGREEEGKVPDSSFEAAAEEGRNLGGGRDSAGEGMTLLSSHVMYW